MYTVSKPDKTMTLHFTPHEWEVVHAYAKWQGVKPNFFVALCIQTSIRTCCDLFPKQLLMPGALDREITKFHHNHEGGV